MSNRLESKIEYEQLPAGGAMTRRQGRWLIVLLIINTMLLAVGVVGPQIGPTVRKGIDDFFARRAAAKAEKQRAASQAAAFQQSIAQQQKFMTYAFPADTIVYEEDPKLAAAYLISGKGYRSIESNDVSSYVGGAWQPPVIAPMPSALTPLPNMFAPNGGVLLVHERRTASGMPKLVCVFLAATERGYMIPNSNDRRVAHEVTLVAHAFDVSNPNVSVPLSFASGIGAPPWKTQSLKLVLPREAETRLHLDNGPKPPEIRPGAYLRVLAGSVDPNDPTHFTIPYQLGTRKGSIDGWLREDGMELRGREGEIGPQSSWKLPPP
jgi:hypothetical protein